jgi:hypothetical protein
MANLSESKPSNGIGTVPEVLLLAGIALFIFEGITTRVLVGCGSEVLSCGTYFRFVWPVFYLALALFAAAAVGFLFMLAQRGQSVPPRA